MAAIKTARERAREELTLEIKEQARRQLAEAGAQQLSLRAVARELGMASSALYRYFPSRDELLTALIIDAYSELADAADQAITAAANGTPRDRWLAAAHAAHTWARANPHQFALIFGSPVPGYAAPQTTIEPAARLPLALIGLVSEATPEPGLPSPPMQGILPDQLDRLSAAFAPELPHQVLARAVTAWVQLIGLISFELGGHFVGSFDPADDFFTWTIEQMADLIGL